MCLSHRHEHGVGFAIADDRLPFAEPGAGPSYGPDRTVVIEHIALSLSIEPEARQFAGTATVRFRGLPAFDGTLALDLDEVDVDGVTDVAGSPLAWRLEGGKLIVKGAGGAVVVRWHGSNPRHGLYFTGPAPHAPQRTHMAWTQCQDEDAHFLVPCHDHPGSKHPWTIELDAPEGYTLLSNGALVEQGTVEGRSHARFDQHEPMPAYLLTAVAARLSVIETSWQGRAVRYLVPVGAEEAVERSMGNTPAMMEEFSAKTGTPFPWPRYDQVVVDDFIFGGMENIACTTMTRLLLVDEKAALEWDAEALVSHELAHQWFGDLVTCQDWAHGWLNESWATFMEVVWTEKAHPPAEAIWQLFDMQRSYFEEESGRYRRPIVSYDFKEPIDVFDRHLYEKGACVLATLRRELGESGFWAGVKHYLDRHAKQTVHTRHFQRAMEDATGRNLDRFFAQWVFSPGHPVLEARLGREDGLVTVAIKQTQSGDGVPDAYAFPLSVEIVGVDGARQTVVLPVRERERTFAVPYAGDVATVRIDAGLGLLARIELKASRAWLEALIVDECPVLAVRAARALLDDGSVQAFQSVVGAMSAHPFYGVRCDLAAQIGRRGGEDARDALLAALRTETEPRAKRAIVDALGNFRHALVADALLGLLAGEFPTWQQHGSVLAALGKTRDPRAITAIRGQLGTRSWARWVTRRGLDGLAETHNVEVIDDLLAHTHSEHTGRTRASAALALAKLADAAESVRPRVVERLVEMLAEDSFFGQLGAIAALASLRDDRALPALSRLHRTAPDGRMRRTAYEAIARTRRGRDGDDAIAGLRKRLDDLHEENHKLRARVEKLERPA